MEKKPSERRIIMAKKLARDWLLKRARPEYRFRVYHNQDSAPYVSLLRSFRDGRFKLAGVAELPDLGVKEEVGGFTVWSSDWKAIMSLKTFFEKKGMDTSWIWTRDGDR